MNSKVNLLVSVIIPVYNVKKYLNRCVESVVSQSYENIEIILVDDGSTDGSGAICDMWAKKDKRISVVRKRNEGLNYARKDGYVRSSGEYVTFLDSDDFFHKDNIRNSMKALIDGEADAVVYASKEFDDLNEGKVSVAGAKEETKLLMTKNHIANFSLFGDNNLSGIQYMTAWGKLYARNLLERINWHDANYRMYEDNFWTPQVLLGAKKVVLMSSPLLFYRRNVAYGASGDNLGNRMTGNSIDGRAVGYLELVDLLQQFYYELARTHGFATKLDKRIDEQAFLSKTWRIDNLARANMLEAENNMEYVLQDLPKYITAKNAHVENLDAEITRLNAHAENLTTSVTQLNDNLEELNREFARVIAEFDQLSSKYEELKGIRRSARLLAGNVKRRIAKPRK